MGRAKAVVVIALLLVLALAIASPALVYVVYPTVAAAATAGLFALPVIFIFIIALILAVRMPSRPSQPGTARKPIPQPHYRWEKLLPSQKKIVKAEEPRASPKISRREITEPSASRSIRDRIILAIILAAALVALILLSPAIYHVLGPDGQLNQSLNVTKVTKVSQPVAPSVPKPQPVPQANATKTTTHLQVIFPKAFQTILKYALIGVAAFLFGGFVAYTYKAADFSEIPVWFSGWLAAVRKDWIKFTVLAAVIAAIILAVSFRRRLGLGWAFNNAISFLKAYLLYVVIGVVALLVIIGVLLLLERARKD